MGIIAAPASYVCGEAQMGFSMQSTKDNAWLMVSIIEEYIIIL